ncbi:hypothetical protein GCM10023192_06070 [Amycolatopsis samaneae]
MGAYSVGGARCPRDALGALDAPRASLGALGAPKASLGTTGYSGRRLDVPNDAFATFSVPYASFATRREWHTRPRTVDIGLSQVDIRAVVAERSWTPRGPLPGVGGEPAKGPR